LPSPLSSWHSPKRVGHSSPVESTIAKVAERGGDLRFETVGQVEQRPDRDRVDHGRVADVSQEVLASLPKSIRRFSLLDDHATFRGWLWTVTRNKIADHCRRWSGARAKGGTAALQLIERLPDQRPETREDVAEVHLRALEGLQCPFNEKTWTAFWRVVVEGDAPRDVAEDLGTTVWTVYKARSRVLSRLRSELGGPVAADD